MIIEYSLYAEKYEDKERLVTALTNNGYVVSSTLLYDGIKPLAYRIDIWVQEEPQQGKKKMGFNVEGE